MKWPGAVCFTTRLIRLFASRGRPGAGKANTAMLAILPALLPLTMALAGCAKPIVQDRPVTVRVPVPAPCTTPRPAAVPSLATTYPDEAWQAMDVRQKAAAVSENAVRLRTYGEQMGAATAACR